MLLYIPLYFWNLLTWNSSTIMVKRFLQHNNGKEVQHPLEQSSAIMLSNIPSDCLQHNHYKGSAFIRLWVLKRHPISRPSTDEPWQFLARVKENIYNEICPHNDFLHFSSTHLFPQVLKWGCFLQPLNTASWWGGWKKDNTSKVKGERPLTVLL